MACDITMDNKFFFMIFMTMHLMTCLGFGMGLYVYTLMDERLNQDDANIINYSAPLDNAVAQFGIEMQQGLAALSLQITLMERNLTKVKIPVGGGAGHFG